MGAATGGMAGMALFTSLDSRGAVQLLAINGPFRGAGGSKRRLRRAVRDAVRGLAQTPVPSSQRPNHDPDQRNAKGREIGGHQWSAERPEEGAQRPHAKQPDESHADPIRPPSCARFGVAEEGQYDPRHGEQSGFDVHDMSEVERPAKPGDEIEPGGGCHDQDPAPARSNHISSYCWPGAERRPPQGAVGAQSIIAAQPQPSDRSGPAAGPF